MWSTCFVIACIILCIFKLSVTDLRNEPLHWSNQIRDSASWMLMTHCCSVWKQVGHVSEDETILYVAVYQFISVKIEKWMMFVCNTAPTFHLLLVLLWQIWWSLESHSSVAVISFMEKKKKNKKALIFLVLIHSLFLQTVKMASTAILRP